MAEGGFDLDEIRRKADIVEIVSPHVRLRKQGKRLSGLCPFHQERTPSFSVDPEKGLFYCFGCKAGGDVFKFVELIEKCTFAEAAELLARRYGVAARGFDGGVRQREKERLFAVHQKAAAYFQSCLARPAAQRARDYVKSRGLSQQTVIDFGIGYAPPTWDALLKALGKQGVPPQELEKAGLVIPSERGGYYDRFRDRLIFPIWDGSGRIIAFGGRALGDQTPKYLNSPETGLFRKGHTLYAFDRARKAMDEAGRAIIVEGYLDAIACHEAGLREAVATLGTALTEDHVQMLRRRVSQIVLSFDSDSAGMTAALRSRDLFQQAEMQVRVVTLPEKTDPDQLIRQQGAEALRARLEAAAPITEWELGRILARGRGKDEAARMQVLKEAIVALAHVPAGVEREYYVEWLEGQVPAATRDQLQSRGFSLREELARLVARNARGARRREEATSGGVASADGGEAPTQPAVGLLEASLLAALIQEGDLAARYAPFLEPEDFPEGAPRAIFAAVRRLVEAGQAVTVGAVTAALDAAGKTQAAALVVQETPQDRVQESMERGVWRLIERRLLRRHSDLLRRLGEVGPGSEQEAVQRELTECTRELNRLKGQRVVG